MATQEAFSASSFPGAAEYVMCIESPSISLFHIYKLLSETEDKTIVVLQSHCNTESKDRLENIVIMMANSHCCGVSEL